MKKIIKIEIILLILLVLAAVGVRLVISGTSEPLLIHRTPEPLPQDEPQQVVEGTPTLPEEEPQEAELYLAATRYFAYDLREEAYITCQGDVDAPLYPASITKLLTSHVVLQHLDPEDTVTVGEDVLALVEEDSSIAELAAEDVLTVEQLIAAMMLPSGNDAAQVSAVAAGRAIAGDSYLDCVSAKQIFVDEMNAQAEALGMENSHFVNPDGWHNESHYTTMDDLVTLCKEVLQNQTILKYTSMAQETVVLNGREVEWKNTNFLLYNDGEAYVPSTIGLKTGYTGEAGGCLVSAFFETDRVILIGVFGGPGFTMDRYLDTVAIYNSL